ncbi:cadherin-like beta sandwich domain-containing protein [Massilia sp. B-10]|nr:cadherin-like beta sandwich domain-containing protein [Massilia sp. B-10]
MADATASITVNGVAVTSGNASGAIALSVGSNTITTIVTAQDGTTTKTYTVTVTRRLGQCRPGRLVALERDARAHVRGKHHQLHGQRRQCHHLADRHADRGRRHGLDHRQRGRGYQWQRVWRDRAERGQQYHHHHRHGAGRHHHQDLYRHGHPGRLRQCGPERLVPVERDPVARVRGLSTTSYTASVGNATTSLTVTPTRSDANASITVNGVAVISGNASGAIALSVGSNTITTIVTAQDGTTTKTYTVTVTRAGSANADLSALSLSSGTLAPVFAA